MRSVRVLTALIAALTVASSAYAQSRGNLRINGKVFDPAGQPVVEAQVRAAKKGEAQPEVFTAKTNKKGEYSINGLAAGEWILEAAKEEVGVKEASVTLNDGARTTTLDITITPPEPKVDPNVEIQEADKRGLDLARSGKVAEARAVYEELLQKYPDVYQLQERVAMMYATEGNSAKGLEHIKLAVEKEPENVDYRVLQAELMMDTGDVDGARAVLEPLDLTKVRDPRAHVNLAIHFINKGQHTEAVDLLTKLIAQFPNEKTLLYYRGRAYVAATKLPEAKTDLEAFVAAAPTAPQAEDAKKLLEQLNKKQ